MRTVISNLVESSVDRFPAEYQYKATLHGQEVTITRYKSYTPKEPTAIPAFPKPLALFLGATDSKAISMKGYT